MTKARSASTQKISDLQERVHLLEKKLQSMELSRYSPEEGRYQRLLQFLTDYIYTVIIQDGEVLATYHGPGCSVVTGYTSEEYAKDPKLWYQMVDEEDRELVTDMSNRALAGEQIEPFEHRIRHKDGTRRWVRNSIVLSLDEAGSVISYDGLIRDITEKKRADELAEIQRQQLAQADKMASMGVLAAGVAHEINNPNNFIVLNSRLLERVIQDARPILDEYLEQNGDFSLAGFSYTEDRESIRHLASGIIEGATRIKEIIGNLRNMTDQQKEGYELVDVNEVAESAVLFVNHIIRDSTEHFRTDYTPSLPKVPGNRQQLEQVVMNLLSNAAQAIENPRQKIILSTKLDEEENRVILRVFDEGVGIPSQNIKRIFDPFFTTKRHLEGSGLGLSISWQIILKHNGSMDVHSEKGKGTTFIVKLPVAGSAS